MREDINEMIDGIIRIIVFSVVDSTILTLKNNKSTVNKYRINSIISYEYFFIKY